MIDKIEIRMTYKWNRMQESDKKRRNLVYKQNNGKFLVQIHRESYVKFNIFAKHLFQN